MKKDRLHNLEEVNCCVCGSNTTEIISVGKDFEYESVADDFSFHKCTMCDHHYLNPRPSPSSLNQIYPDNYGNYSNSQKFSLPFAVKSWMEHLFIKKLFRIGNTPQSILDVGCGDGRLLKIVKSIASNKCTLEGIEISKQASMEAEKKGFSITTSSIETINLPKGVYDYIFMIQVIEHLHKPYDSIIKLKESLKKGGVLVIETPDTDCIDYNIFSKRYWGGYHYPRHFNLFKKVNLQKLIKLAGLRVIHSSNKIQPVHWIWSLHHIIEEKIGRNIISKSLNIKNPIWITIFTIVDALQVFFLNKSSNQRIIAQK